MNRLDLPADGLSLDAHRALLADRELQLLGKLVPGGHLAAESLRRQAHVVRGPEDTRREFWKAVAAHQEASRASGVDELLGLHVADRELEGWSLGRLIRGQVGRNPTGESPLEWEIAKHVEDRTGSVASGVWAPLPLLSRACAFRDFNTSAPTEAGNLIGSGARGGGADPIRAASVCLGLGASLITGLRATSSIPSFNSTSSIAWQSSEISSASSVVETTTENPLVPCRISATMVVSRQAILQSAVGELDALLARHLVAGLFSRAEDGVFNGSGSGGEPTGLRTVQGTTVVAIGASGGALSWSALSDLEAAPAVANVPLTTTGWAINPTTLKYVRRTARASGLGFMLDDSGQLLGHRVGVTGVLPSNLTKSSGSNLSALVFGANWADLIIGVWGGGADIVIDRVTMADIGKVRITASLYCCPAFLKPSSFALCVDAAC